MGISVEDSPLTTLGYCWLINVLFLFKGRVESSWLNLARLDAALKSQESVVSLFPIFSTRVMKADR